MGTEYLCIFFVVPGNGPALLGMIDCKQLHLLSIHCQTINNQHNGRQTNEQTKHDTSMPANSFKNNLYANDKIKQGIDYFIAGPGMESNIVENTETTLKIHTEYNDVFTGIGCFKGAFSLWVKDGAKPYQVLLRHVANALQRPYKKS